jgi:DNA-binding response OmpR family regulator
MAEEPAYAGSGRILVVDDDQELCDLLATYLQREGFTVTCVYDGEAGLGRAESESFDLLILDVMLPTLPGLEVLRRLRRKSTTPVLMLTARGEEVDRIVGLELGADDYLPKPFNPRELLARLAAILRRTRGDAGQAGAVLRIGPLEIDRASREVRVRGQRRELTGRQFDLLLLLAERAGRVQTREQLMDALKGEEWDSVDRSIDVHISRIRQLIEDDARHPRLVQTVRGAGYVLTPPAGPRDEP